MANQRCWIAAGIVPALVLTPPSARAEPEVTQRVVTYDVSGATPAEIRASLNRNGPADQRANRHRDAWTNWYVRWLYRYVVNGQGCNIASVSTSVEITITMPRLKPGPATPPEVARAFTAYTDKLLIHEQGHRENGMVIARRVEAEIGKHPPRSTCDELSRAVNALGDRIITDEGARLDMEYDERTQYGRTQGATFP